MSRLDRTLKTILGLNLVCVGMSFSQNASVIWINAFPRDTCFSGEVVEQRFGNHIHGTYGNDSALGEFECPPSPPPPYDAMWWNIPGRSWNEWGGLRCGYDIRGWSSPSQTDTFLLRFYSDCDSTSPFVFRWPDPSYLSARCDSMFIIDLAGRFPKVNMFSVDSLRVPWNNNITVDRFLIIKYGARLVDTITDITRMVWEGWNLVSVPVTVADRRRTSVFPTSISNAIGYTPTGYITRDTLEYGVGYWLKFPSTQSVPLTGDARIQDTIAVVQGWNIIGSISQPVLVHNIIQIPAGIVVSPYFDYVNTGYTPTAFIVSMRGYWVKVSQNGWLVLR